LACVVAFCEAIGDPHPIHRDPQLARELGLDGAVVPGTLLATLMLAETERAARPRARVSLRFKSWVRVDELLTFDWVTPHRLRLVGEDGRTCAVARVS
jgi:acyl dehydratase